MSVPKVAGLRKINYHVRHEQQNNYVLPSPKIGGWDAHDWLKFACVAELSLGKRVRNSPRFFLTIFSKDYIQHMGVLVGEG